MRGEPGKPPRTWTTLIDTLDELGNGGRSRCEREGFFSAQRSAAPGWTGGTAGEVHG